MTNIASVVEVGEAETCDLEVDHPDHQLYLANGMLTSNSHAVAYAIDSYWCAWLLTHHEEEWLSAYLEAMSNTPLGRAKAFAEVKALGYQIVPIDVNLAKRGWSVLPGKRLMPSITSCKGIGDGAVDELFSVRPINSIEELLWNDDGSWRPSKFNKKALDTLIRVKAFDSVGCVGPDKVFKSYKHMHSTLLGSFTEKVRQTRKGVTDVVVRQRDHLNLVKQSTAKDPHRGRKAFYELARQLAAGDTSEWTPMELANNYAAAFGTADVTMMFDQRLFDKLAEKGVASIEELDVGQTKLAWFVTVLAAFKKGAKPTAGTMKKTTHGKPYGQQFVTGPTGKPIRVNVWGCKELYPAYQLLFGEVTRNDMGYSTNSWRTKVIA